MKKISQIASVYKKMKLSEQESDFAYWQSRPYQERLEAWAQIRRDYHGWNDDSEPRLERVYRIIKRS
jgi:hypothetical protein